MIAVFAIYFALPAVALSRAAGHAGPADGNYTTLLGAAARTRAASPATRCSASSSTSTSASLQHPAEIYVGLLAATILFIATNAGIIGVSRLVYSMGLHRQMPDRLRQLHPQLRHAVDRDPRLRRHRVPDADPGQGRRSWATCTRSARCCRSRSRTSRSIRLRLKQPDQRGRTAGPGNIRDRAATTCRCSPSLGGLGTGMAFVVVTALHLDVAVAGARLAGRSASLVYVVYRRRQGLDLHARRTKVAIPRPVVEHEAEYDSILVAFDGDGYYAAGASPRRPSSRRAGAAGIHVLVTLDRAGLARRSTPPLPEQERAAAGDHRAGQVQGGRRVSGPRRAGPRRARPGRAIVEEAREMRARAIVMPLPRARRRARCSARRSRPCWPSARAG